jgi:hypothetical protein
MAINTGIQSLDAGAPELRLEGEQQAGGVYQQGSEVKNALAVWANMGPEDRAGFEGFLDFFRSGAWRDQIQGMRSQERDTRTASAPGIEDTLNDLAMEEFNKPLNQLTPEERQMLMDMAREQAASGGRIGYAGGKRIGFLHGSIGAPASTGRASPASTSGGGDGWQNYAIPAAPVAQPTVEATLASEDIGAESIYDYMDPKVASTLTPAQRDLVTGNITGDGAVMESVYPPSGNITGPSGDIYAPDDPTRLEKEDYGITRKDIGTGDYRDVDPITGEIIKPTITTGGEGEGPIVTDTTTTVPVDTGLTTEEEAAAVAALDYGTTFPTEFQDVSEAGRLYGLRSPVPTVTAPQISFEAARGGRAGYDRGGIANLRQAYGIGDIVKAPFKAVKKVLKSPIGKAALIAGLGYYGGTQGFFGQKIKDVGWKKFIASKLPWASKVSPDSENTILKVANKIFDSANFKGEYSDAIEIAKASIKKTTTKGGLGAMDYAAMVGIPLAMKGAYEMPTQDDTEEMAKYTAELDKKADIWREKYGRTFTTTPPNLLYPEYAAKGGRIGLADGRSIREAALRAMYGEDEEENTGIKQFFSDTWRAAKGGRVAAQEGGLMDLGGIYCRCSTSGRRRRR